MSRNCRYCRTVKQLGTTCTFERETALLTTMGHGQGENNDLHRTSWNTRHTMYQWANNYNYVRRICRYNNPHSANVSQISHASYLTCLRLAARSADILNVVYDVAGNVDIIIGTKYFLQRNWAVARSACPSSTEDCVRWTIEQCMCQCIYCCSATAARDV